MAKKKLMKKSNFILRGGFVTIALFLVGLLEFTRRIFITNIIGDEGNAYFSCAYEIYFLLAGLFSAVLPIATSKIIAARMARGQFKNANRAAQLVFLISCIAGLVGILSCLFASFFLKEIMQTPLAQLSLQCFIPAIFISTFSSSYKSLFLGIGAKTPVAVATVIQQLVIVMAVIPFSMILSQYGTKISMLLLEEDYKSAYGAAGVSIGISIGVLVELIFLIILFFSYRTTLHKQRMKDLTKILEDKIPLLKLLGVAIIPVFLYQFIQAVSILLSQILFNQFMVAKQKDIYMHLYFGVFYGKYRTLILLPVSIITIYAVSIVSQISQLHKKEEPYFLKKRSSSVFKVGTVFIMPFVIFLSVLAKPISEILFSGEQKMTVQMLQTGSIVLLFMTVVIISSSILQGMGKLNIVIINALISLILQIGSFVLGLYLTDANIYGLVYSFTLSSLCNAILNIWYLTRKMRYRQEFIKTFIIPILCACVVGIIVFFMNQLLNTILPSMVSCILSMLFGVLFYYLAILFAKVLEDEELMELPFGSLLQKAGKKLFHTM